MPGRQRLVNRRPAATLGVDRMMRRVSRKNGGASGEIRQGLHVLTRVALTLAPICQAEGLTLSQYRHLFLIAEEPRRAGALAVAFEVSRPMVAQSIGALEP